MKFSPGTFVQSRFLLALVAGLLLASAFPKLGIAGFAWIAPGLMLAAALGTRGAESFRIGYVAGLAHYLTSLYWLLLIPYRWHSIPLGPATGWLALSAYMALFPATWVWMVMKVAGAGCQGSGEEGERKQVPNIQHSTFNIQHPMAALAEIASWNWSRRMGWAFFCAASWVALEMLAVRLFGGFPWNLLGSSQYRILPLIQIASLVGVHGVSFLVVWTSVSLLGAAAAIFHRPNVRSVWLGDMLFPMIAVATAFAFGFNKISSLPPPLREMKVTLVQPSIPQTLIWESANDMERFHGLIRLSEQALTNETDLLIWPEAAIPKLLRYHEEIRGPILRLAREHHVWMIVGSDDAEPRAGSVDPDAVDYFNSAFLISPQGELVGRYCKRNLVIFGEYVPLVRWLPFLKWFTPIDGGFTPGTEATRFALGELKIKIAPLICYEDTFPQLGRSAAGGDTDLLVNLTNDGWFGEGAAQWQQAAGAVFRAVENGLPLVRCANTGLTCWIDAAGRMRDIFTDPTGSVYGAGFVTVQIPLAETRTPTFFQQHGDWWGWSCVALTALVFGRRVVMRSIR